MSPETLTTLNSVLLLLFGWGLGLVGPAIVERIRKDRLHAEVRETVEAELHELRYRLAATVMLLERALGTTDRALYEWLLPRVGDYRGPNANEGLAESIQRLLELTDPELVRLIAQFPQATGTALGVKKLKVSYLESRLADLGGFKEPERLVLFDLKSRVDIYNEEVDQVRYFFQLTYSSSISAENYSRADQQLSLSYRSLCTLARQMVERIESL